jgi:ribosome-binding factor A
VQGRRLERLSALVREELGNLLVGRAKDPSLARVTITAVKVSPDLDVARVFYVAPEGEAEAARRDLSRAAPFLRRELGARLRLKRTPELRFAPDEGFEQGLRIESILREISAPGPEPGPEPGAEPEPGQGGERS